MEKHYCYGIFGYGSCCRPGKSCKMSSSGKFSVLECPQNRMIGNMYIECWFGMTESSKLDSPSSILYFSYFFLKSPLINLNFPSSALLPPSSVKSTGNLTQNVLKITGFLTKCPQAPLAPLAAFCRSVCGLIENIPILSSI